VGASSGEKPGKDRLFVTRLARPSRSQVINNVSFIMGKDDKKALIVKTR
jgi:hypothetical protein